MSNLDFSSDVRGSGLLWSLLSTNSQGLLSTLAGIEGTEQLRTVQDQFERYAAGLSTLQLANLLKSGGIPSPLSMPRPNPDLARYAAQYAQPQPSRFGNSALGRFLSANPFERSLLEMALGGRIVSSSDDKLQLIPFTPGAFNFGGANSDFALAAQGMLSAMMRSAASQPGFDPSSQSMFYNVLAAGLANVLTGQSSAQSGTDPNGFSSLRANGTSPFTDWSEDSPEMRQRRALQGMSGQGLGGPQSFQDLGGMPGAQSTQALGIPDDTTGVLNDPGLTVEDKVTLMIMIIMKQMDQQIEAQANYINALQQQQQAGGKGGKGGGASGAPSIDVETMKLKRLIDKRSQMFDMLRQIIDKYNQTAKGIIDSIGR